MNEVSASEPGAMDPLNLSPDERRSLVGPAVVGAILGLLLVLGTLAFASDYREASVWVASWPRWADLTLQCITSFGLAVLGCVIPLGVLPLVVRRWGR